MKKRTLALLLALILCVGCAIGGTVAWLMYTTEPITTTFTTSDINITLEETNAQDNNSNSYKMVPGATITKDPVVTVKEGSEACWVFVKLEKMPASIPVNGDRKSFDDFFTYSIDSTNGWTSLYDVDGVAVYYMKITDATTDIVIPVISNNTIYVADSVTKEMMDAAKNNPPALAVTAYAIQSEHLSYPTGADDTAKANYAWSLVSQNPPTISGGGND